MTQVYQQSGYPWTSKSITVEPKFLIKIKPLSIQSQKGYKIKTRSALNYSCADRSRDEIFKDNYDRRQYQVTKCGYWSDISKPYKSVGDVELDTRVLVLKTLDQHIPSHQNNDKALAMQQSRSRKKKSREKKTFKFYDPVTEHKEPYNRTAECIIKRELTAGRNRMSVVKSGSNFFEVIAVEQQQKSIFICYSIHHARTTTKKGTRGGTT